MEKAIQKAIEGGWRPKDLPTLFEWKPHVRIGISKGICAVYFGTKIKGAREENIIFRISEALIDPLFWQALGKAMGWKIMCVDCNQEATVENIQDKGYVHAITISFCPNRCYAKNYRVGWLYHWHHFIDHLAEGKDADSFFNELIK